MFPELTYPVASILFTLVKNLRDVIEQIVKHKSIDQSTQKQQFYNIPETFENLIDYLLNLSESFLDNINQLSYCFSTSNICVLFILENADPSTHKHTKTL